MLVCEHELETKHYQSRSNPTCNGMPTCAHVFIVTGDVTDEFSQFFSYHIPSFLLVVELPDPDFSCCVQYYVYFYVCYFHCSGRLSFTCLFLEDKII